MSPTAKAFVPLSRLTKMYLEDAIAERRPDLDAAYAEMLMYKLVLTIDQYRVKRTKERQREMRQIGLRAIEEEMRTARASKCRLSGEVPLTT